ncbi:MAG: OmpA family protein [Bacteroidetes bacterium]|nr:OmpA family protein [Bacteroidota bacterium]
MIRSCSNILKVFPILLLLTAGILNAQKNPEGLFNEAASSLNLVVDESGDVLFPEEYADAVSHYQTAVKYKEKSKSPADIQIELEKVISILTKINDSVEERSKTFGTVLIARQTAVKSNADRYAVHYWDASENKFMNAIEDYSDKDYKDVQEAIPLLLDNYNNAKKYADFANNLVFNWTPLNNTNASLANLLAPLSYSQSAAKLNNILESISEGNDLNQIKTSVDDAAVLFNKSTENAKKFSGRYSGLLRIRKDAETAGAEVYASELWNAAEEILSETALTFEKDRTERAAESSLDAALKYLEAKHLAVRTQILSKTDELIQLAEKGDADEYAPKTFNESKSLAKSVTDMIYSDNYDYSNLKNLAAHAETKAILAINVTRTIKEVDSDKNSWEDLILAWNIFGNHDNLAQEKQTEYVPPVTKDVGDAAQTKRIPSEVAGIFNPNEAEILESGDEIIIRITGIKFQWLGYSLDDNAEKILDKAIQVLKYFPSSTITIAGHNDYVAAKTFNQEISQRRADNVRTYILLHSNIDPDRIIAVGYGETLPITNDKTFEAREKNRRIELIIK